MTDCRIADDPLRGSRRLLHRVRGRRSADHPPGEAPCRILVGGASGLEALATVLTEITGLPVGAGACVHDGLRLSLGRNVDAGSTDAGRWPHALELAPVEPVPHDRYVELASTILRGLWSRDLRAVAFCAFPADLPTQARPAARRV